MQSKTLSSVYLRAEHTLRYYVVWVQTLKKPRALNEWSSIGPRQWSPVVIDGGQSTCGPPARTFEPWMSRNSVPKVDTCDYLGLDRGLRKGNNALRQKDWIGAQVEWSASPLKRKLRTWPQAPNLPVRASPRPTLNKLGPELAIYPACLPNDLDYRVNHLLSLCTSESVPALIHPRFSCAT